MHSLTWQQVNAWRLTQHYLLKRAAWDDMLTVISVICGLHAQTMSAVELALCARVDDIVPKDVQQALWELRTLVKSWLMRGAVHVVTTEDYPIYVAALSTLTYYQRESWRKYHGVTQAELDTIIKIVRGALSDKGMTRERLAYVVSQQAHSPRLQELLLAGWSTLLKPVALQGDLCHGPDVGQSVTFVSPKAWIGEGKSITPQEAVLEVGRRYLKAYGPATSDDLSRWIGFTSAQARQIFADLGDEVVAVNVEGHEAMALISTLEPMAALPAPDCVRLLPFYDPYTVALSKQRHVLMNLDYESLVFRPQGLISPVVLVDGLIEGVWEYERLRDQVSVQVKYFGDLTERVREGIQQETARISVFLEMPVEVSFVQLS